MVFFLGGGGVIINIALMIRSFIPQERMQLLFPSERGDTQTGQGQEEVAALERSSEENNRDETTISPFQQMVWRLEKPKYFLGIIYLL